MGEGTPGTHECFYERVTSVFGIEAALGCLKQDLQDYGGIFGMGEGRRDGCSGQI